MRLFITRQRIVPFFVLLTLACGGAAQTPTTKGGWLSAPEQIARGVEFFKSGDTSLVEPAAPISVSLLRLDPARVRLTSLLSNDEVMYAEPVLEIAARAKALAAVNAGFFNINNGEPVGLLKVAGELVSDTPIAKGAIAIWSPEDGRTTLAFDQISARVQLHFLSAGQPVAVPVDGVDTTRARGKLMLYSPKYHAHTDTTGNGVEWLLGGEPLAVISVRRDVGSTPIPPDGLVLSYGGLDLPPALQALVPGVAVEVRHVWTSIHGLENEQLESADHIVNGAGLLRRGGVPVTNWDVEKLSGTAFIQARHPRTIIGVDRSGFVWLAVVDGRQETSVGMTFVELQRLADRLELTDALNLDGGGSSTMVVRGKIVNRPSDASGPRAVSDALGITVR
ncbi:MAG TPA: phosphodiester glycosidase family protein [Vicinamibacterales bacterium]|nr:phosphodiester glycosidase family protein [Vicinamibacterales bacterium]